MITAVEAYERSLAAKEELEGVYKSNLEILIENAIREGRFKVFYEGVMYADLFEELGEKGFTIGKVRRFNPDRVLWEISWESAVEENEGNQE